MNKDHAILIVDDDQRNIFALHAVLKARNYQCVTASTAASGIRQLNENNNIAVVLLDMMMPDMDGYETIRVIRNSDRRDIFIVAVTAQAMPGDMEKCLAAGADAYVPKPVDLDVLAGILNDVLN